MPFNPSESAKRAARLMLAHVEITEKYTKLILAARTLVRSARTSGGVAGPDEGLKAACENVEYLLGWRSPPNGKVTAMTMGQKPTMQTPPTTEAPKPTPAPTPKPTEKPAG